MSIKKLLLVGVSLIMVGSITLNANATETSINTYIEDCDGSPEQMTEQSEEELDLLRQKEIERDEYLNFKSLQRSYDEIKVLPKYKREIQEESYQCGPYAAYNGTNGLTSAKNFENNLHTSRSSGTPFPGWWSSTLNLYYGKNLYAAKKAQSCSSISAWRDELKKDIIATIDSGYPVIADCYIYGPDTYLHPDYRNATHQGTRVIRHYVAVVGYDDRPNTIPAEVCIVDSYGAIGSRMYWTSLDKLKVATWNYGIVW